MRLGTPEFKAMLKKSQKKVNEYLNGSRLYDYRRLEANGFHALEIGMLVICNKTKEEYTQEWRQTKFKEYRQQWREKNTSNNGGKTIRKD